nr:DUF3793 family protein [Vallitalea pronyensis]
MHTLWDAFKNKLMIIGSLLFYKLKRTNNHILVLFFIPRYFMDIIRCPYNSSFLVKLGYGNCDDIDACLQRLKERYKHSKCPHEIGLFLGVPLEDVKSFIKHNGKHIFFVVIGKCIINLSSVLSFLMHMTKQKTIF